MRRKILNVVNVFSLFHNYLPLERAWPFIRSMHPLHTKMLCADFGWNWPIVFGEDFCILSVYFRYLAISYPWKMTWLFIWTNLNTLYPRMLCAKFGWNWHSGSLVSKERWKWNSENTLTKFKEPLGQFQPNLARSILKWRRFNVLQLRTTQFFKRRQLVFPLLINVMI